MSVPIKNLLKLTEKSADPGTLADGDMWIRSDLALLKHRSNSTVITNTPNSTWPQIFPSVYAITTPGSAVATVTPTLNKMFAVPFMVPRKTTLVELQLNVSTLGAAGSQARVGLYGSLTTGMPGALITDYGIVTTTTTGYKTWTPGSPPTLLPSVLYFAAMAMQGATAVFRSAAGQDMLVHSVGANPTGLVGNENAYNTTASTISGALPDPFGAVASTQSIRFGLKFS